MNFKKGYIHIIPNDSEDHKYETYLGVREDMSRGLFISRENPDLLPDSIKDVSDVIWLSSTRRADSLDPYNVGILTDRISEYITENGDAVVFLDGVEYMMEGTDFSRVFRSLGYLKERLSLTESVMIIPIEEETLEKREIALMKREFLWEGN